MIVQWTIAMFDFHRNVFQPSTKSAVDVEQSTESTSVETVYAKKNALFTGDVYADTKVSWFTCRRQWHFVANII